MAATANLRAFLSALGHVEAGGVIEVSIFQDGDVPTHLGYFSDLDAAVKAIAAQDGRGNIFVTLNPAMPAMLARANNRLVEGSFKKKLKRTKDTEIHRDCWFLFDVDPERPSGISATNDEKREAHGVAKAVRDWLLSVGVPASAMMTCDSGNGGYVIVRTLDCEVNDEHIDRKKAFLNFVADQFDAPQVKIDRTVYNPARLIGALGAMKVKGENIPERPHRRSAVFTVAGDPFDPAQDQCCEPFDLYDLAAKILPPAEDKKAKQTSSNKSAASAYTGFDARKIAHLLTNHKPTSNGFDRYDCPNCGNTQKFWINPADNGKFGCYEPDSVCNWRKLYGKVCEIARENGVEEPKQAQQKADVETVLSRIVTAQTILETDYPEPMWAVKGLIPQGVTFIAGPPKLGKSIFALNLAVAVAEGGKALSHFDVEPGSVLVLALEDGERRIQERLRKLTSGRISGKLEVVTEWPRLNQGGLEAIDAWIERHKDARLLIVDTLKMLRPVINGRDRNVYDADYEAIQPLTKVASQRIALNIVHHTRKAIADDPLATVSGSYGLTGAADGVLVLRRSRNRSDATLSVIGRDVEEQELALEFKPDICLWSALGKAEELRKSGERQEILDLLHQTGEPMSPSNIAELLDKRPSVIRNLLWKMKGTDEIKLFGNKYQLPDYQPPEPTKIRKSARAKNISASPETNSARDAPKSSSGNGLDPERLGVSDDEHISEQCKAPDVSNNGDAETEVAQVLKPNGIDASLLKNVSGDARDAGTNGIPFLITRDMRRRLYELNYKGPDINKMTPAEAHAILDAAQASAPR